jgi:hypothetical protein
MAINDNYVNVARYRGPIRPCEFCRNATLPLALRAHCKFCLTNGYVAQCLKCDGTGTIKGIAPWDNSSEHGSTCDICGGTGVLPAREPETVTAAAALTPISAPEKKETKPTTEPLPAA